MIFKKFPSIENSYREKTISEIRKFGFHLYDWVVLNKVHGANFSIWYDGKELKCAKRTGFITDPNEKFYGYKDVVRDYEQRVKSTHLHFQNLLNSEVELVLCGEIFGGSYPHPDVKCDIPSIKVQKGVYYCPHNDFYLFDIMVNGRFISHDDVVKIGNEFGFICAKPLFEGNFEDCMDYDPVFQDPTYKVFGFPPIEDNESEGVVLKPNIPAFFPNGARCILKKKNPKFKEKTRKKKKVQKELPAHLKEKVENASQYITENRLRNVLSHGLEIGQKDFGKLIKAFLQDIIDKNF